MGSGMKRLSGCLWVVVAMSLGACGGDARSVSEHREDAAGAGAGGASLGVATGFEGVWRSTYGAMRLMERGSEVRGTYAWAGGSVIHGTCEGRSFTFSYEEPDGASGTGVFTLSDDDESFAGTWRAADGTGGEWTGTRGDVDPERIWLIVLEANWEDSLETQEYSYGEMLASFFRRTPDVQVRRRTVSDLADLRRWCAEVAYLEGPVVLYISSHGTSEGLELGGEFVGAQEVADAVRLAGPVRLVHFGSCMVMGGSLPRLVSAPGEDHDSVPVSGYRESADWSQSAVIDFAYLSLVLEEGLTAWDAAARTTRSIEFARSNGFEIYPPATP